MPLPEHVTPALDSRRGHAPYNFVPLPEAIFHAEPFRQHDRLAPERLHGFIELTITTETEFYTRCAYPPAEEQKTVQQSRPRQAFYHLGDEGRPVIPGSSLRGMTRALVEILAYSRLTRRSKPGDAQRILDEKLVHRAVADQNTPTGQAYNERFLKRIKPMQFDYPSDRVQAGYLEAGRTAGEWQIRPARKFNGVSFVRVKLDTLSRHGFSTTKENDVEDVWVKPEPKKPYPHRGGLILNYARTENLAPRTASFATAPAGMEPGKLIYSGPMRSRHMHTVIYEQDTKATPIPIPEAMWEQFCEDRDQQRGIPCRRIGRSGDPLFYLLDASGKLEFIGPTLFFRLPYKNYAGDYMPQFVDADGPLDLAEAIFGTVNGEPQEGKPQTGSHKGRVRFDDAEWIEIPGGGSPFLEGSDGIRWPAVLSKPKPTSYQNYLVQSDPEGRRENLLSYSSAPPDNAGSTTTALRGFKLYWHRGSAEKDLQIEKPEKYLKQFTVIRPVKPEMEFRGRVRFENLCKLELGALLAALELPVDYRHHLGMGKPLGMGSVRIQAVTTLYDPVKRYQSLAADGRLEQAAQDDKLVEAREAFRKVIVEHHNCSVPTLPVPENAELWEIPRLRTLGLLLDWTNKPPREETAYIRELKKFRDRQVLPTPAGVLKQPEPAPPTPAGRSPSLTTQTRPAVEQDWISSTPALKTLQAILQDNGRSQREQLEAIDDALSTGQKFQSPEEILEFLGEVEGDIAQEIEAVAEKGLEGSLKGFFKGIG